MKNFKRDLIEILGIFKFLGNEMWLDVIGFILMAILGYLLAVLLLTS